MRLDDVGGVRLDDVGDVRHDVERNRGGRCHRGVLTNHRLTIKLLEDAEVDPLVANPSRFNSQSSGW